MRRLILIPVCFVALLVPVVVLAAGGEGGFNGVVSSIESRYHVHATRIPFLGLVSFISRRATNGGVGGIHIAEFEHFSAGVDGNELNQLVEQKLFVVAFLLPLCLLRFAFSHRATFRAALSPKLGGPARRVLDA